MESGGFRIHPFVLCKAILLDGKLRLLFYSLVLQGHGRYPPRRVLRLLQPVEFHDSKPEFASIRSQPRDNSAIQWKAYKLRFYCLEVPASKPVCNNTGYTAKRGNSKHCFPQKTHPIP